MPCFMVITRWPRRCISAARRTVSVVLPCFLVPMIVTIGGRGMSLRELELVRGVHVHEEALGIAEAPHVLGRESRDSHLIEESDHPPVVDVERPLDRRDARRRVERAQRLEPAPRSVCSPAPRHPHLRPARAAPPAAPPVRRACPTRPRSPPCPRARAPRGCRPGSRCLGARRFRRARREATRRARVVGDEEQRVRRRARSAAGHAIDHALAVHPFESLWPPAVA